LRIGQQENGDHQAYRQSGNIQQRKKSVFQKAPPRDFKVIFEHDVWFKLLIICAKQVFLMGNQFVYSSLNDSAGLTLTARMVTKPIIPNSKKTKTIIGKTNTPKLSSV